MQTKVIKTFVSNSDESATKVTANADIHTIVKSIKPPTNDDRGMIANVHRLLTASTIAQQVQATLDQKVILKYKESVDHYNKSINETDPEKTNFHLNQARLILFKAAQSITSTVRTTNKLESDFTKKKASVESLIVALLRISKEKGAEGENLKVTIKEAKALKNDAQTSSQSGDWIEAKKSIDHAYLLVKTSIQNLRQGDVLVKSLNFESPEEEYQYEVDRNKTHFMLLILLVERKTNLSSYSSERIVEYRKTAEMHSNKSKQHVKDKDYESAIEELEKSTKNLLRAIRIGGVFIPG